MRHRAAGTQGRSLQALLVIAMTLGSSLAACGGTTNPPAGSSAKKATSSTTTAITDQLATLVSTTQSGIVRIETTTCAASEVGTGFLIGPRLVATVEHVVDGAVNIRLKQNGKTVGVGTVIGEDPTRDVALVRTSVPLHGHVLKLASRAPRLGETVAALGFPFGLPLTVTQGSVSGLGRTIPINGINRQNLVQTDAAINPGNSGGPLISVDTGEVVGLVDLGATQANGIGFAVSAVVAQPVLNAWTAAPQTVPSANCPATTSPATTSPATTSPATTSPATTSPATTSPATTSPAPTSPTTTSPTPSVLTYTGNAFSIDYPSSWIIQSAEQQHSYGTDTTIVSPYNANTLLRIDVNATSTITDPRAAAQPVINTVSQAPGYQLIDLTRGTFEHFPALHWEFVADSNGVLVREEDEFFIDAYNGDSVAILTEAPATRYPSDAAAFAQLRQTLAMH
jgi:S1-C subfamily serine protease